MTHEKEIAYLKNRAEQPELESEREVQTHEYRVGMRDAEIELAKYALKIVEAQQKEIEALKVEEKNTEVFLKLADMAAGKAKEKVAKLQKENAELKEKLEIATNTLNILSTKQIFEPATTNSYAREALEQLKKN